MADLNDLRRVPFTVPMRVPVADVVERTGWLIEGPEGWGEWSPLPSWDAEQRAAAERGAVEAATLTFPAATREAVEVNAMIPRIAPSDAAALAVASGCRTIKIKVGDPDSVERVRAVREALPAVKIRLDANASWPPEVVGVMLAQMLALDIELIEDPVADVEEMARFRKGSSVLIAAESCVRTIADARRVRMLGAADVLVVKPQRIGGIRAALAAAEEAGIPTIASSALETSVGLASVLAVAAALPDGPFAHGIGTQALLASDVTDDPLVPVDGLLEPRRVVPRDSVQGDA